MMDKMSRSRWALSSSECLMHSLLWMKTNAGRILAEINFAIDVLNIQASSPAGASTLWVVEQSIPSTPSKFCNDATIPSVLIYIGMLFPVRHHSKFSSVFIFSTKLTVYPPKDSCVLWRRLKCILKLCLWTKTKIEERILTGPFVSTNNLNQLTLIYQYCHLNNLSVNNVKAELEAPKPS